MDLAQPHRGRTFQIAEFEGALWMDNEDCALNLTLLHHLKVLGWRFTD